MIIRVFRTRIKPDKRMEFERIVKETLPLLRSQKGLVACYPGKPTGSNSDEFVVVTVWRDLPSLKRFAGEKWEEPVLSEEERGIMDEWFTHNYESDDFGQ